MADKKPDPKPSAQPEDKGTPKAADPKMEPEPEPQVVHDAETDEDLPVPDQQMPTDYTARGAAEPITDDHISPDEQQTSERGEDYRKRTGKA